MRGPVPHFALGVPNLRDQSLAHPQGDHLPDEDRGDQGRPDHDLDRVEHNAGP